MWRTRTRDGGVTHFACLSVEMIDEKRSKSNNDQQKSFKKMNTNAKLSIKKRMTLRRVIDLRSVDNSDFDSIILNDEKKSIYAVIIVETFRKERSLRSNITITFRKVVFEYFINVKTARARELRNQRLNDLEQNSITRAKRNDEIAIRYV
jgi:pyruvate/2-oxoglutarate/acetoin dehydrogenase E1 component